ncbi:MAG: glycogen/starch synthase, partial [Clostridia bacterium]|nr:glycogen/starch synthase [Clostridia bacterium]
MREETQMAGNGTRIAFVGSECYPFVKTGGLGDVMYALPRALKREGCEVRVILPYYACIPQKFKDKVEWKGSFMMDLCQGGQSYFVGIMETEIDGVIYDLIDNREFFDWGNPYTGLWEDIPKYCYFSKAALAVLNYLEWIPDVVHCHDWQAALTPVYLRTNFAGTPVGAARSILTIHNLRFQGICSVQHLKYWSGLPDYLFDYPVFLQVPDEANMFKGGLAYADRVTTVSAT